MGFGVVAFLFFWLVIPSSSWLYRLLERGLAEGVVRIYIGAWYLEFLCTTARLMRSTARVVREFDEVDMKYIISAGKGHQSPVQLVVDGGGRTDF